MDYLDAIDLAAADFSDLYDELPLWSAPFGLDLLDRVPIKSGLTILDVGAGTGFLSIELAERCGPGTKLIAIDPWTASMERLRRKIAQRHLENITLLEHDACAIALPDASIDVIVSNLGINNFDDPAAVMRECARLAKPGAALFLTTNLVGHMAEFYEVYREVLIDTGQRDRLAVLAAHINHRGTIESVGALLQGAGFKVVEVAPNSFRIRFASGSTLLRHHFIRLGFVQGWKSIVAVGSIQKTFERLESALNAVSQTRGELTLTIPTACFVAYKPTSDHLDPKNAT